MMSRSLLFKSFIGLSLLINYVFAQGWTEPVNVSKMGKFCNAPKMCVDHDGAIHAVWSMTVTQQYRKIMYAKSEDMGNNWTIPVAIADDSLQWFAQPGIACDLQNHLYVAFEGDAMSPSSSLIYLVKFNGTLWSEPMVISDGYPGSMHTRMIADNTGRIYCFWDGWYNGKDKIFYRYHENGIWSDIVIPYTNFGEFYFLSNVVADEENNLHCVGYYLTENQNYTDSHIYYFYFYRSTSQWSPFELISDTNCYVWDGSDISLDCQQIPHFTWNEYFIPDPDNNNATLYRYPVSSGWLPIDTIELNRNSHAHQLLIDQNDNSNTIVVEWPLNNQYSRLINYKKYDNEWFREIIDSIHGAIYTPDVIELNDNIISVIYVKSPQSGDTTKNDIYFSKYDIYTEIPKTNFSADELIAIPNPFSTWIKILYTINKECNVLLDIYDANGRLIERLINQVQLPGDYCILWQSTNDRSDSFKKGIYFIRLHAGKYLFSRSVIKL